MEDERPVVTWMPVVPGFGVTLIVTGFVWILGTVLAVAAAGVLVAGIVRRQWTAWSWAAIGALLAYGIFWLLLVLHRVF